MNRDRWSYGVSLLVLTALASGTWWAADHARRSIQADPPRRISHEPDFFVERFGMVRSNPQGRAHTVLQGDRLVHYPDDDSSELSTPQFWSLQPDQPLVQVRALQGRMDQMGQRVSLDGKVVWERAADAKREKMVIETPNMILLPDDDVAYGASTVVVQQGRNQLQGVGFHYDNQSRQLRIAQQSRVLIAPHAVTSAPSRPEKKV